MFFHSSRALWFTHFISNYPTPSSVLKYTQDEFIKAAWEVVGRKVDKRNWLINFYQTAQESIGLPLEENSQAIDMFRVILHEHQGLCKRLKEIEETADSFLQGNNDYNKLLSIPGIGPILALMILAEVGNLRRFKHYRQFLKFCGFDLKKMKFEFMQTHANQFSIERMSKMLNVSRNGYYKFMRSSPSKREEENKSLLTKIKLIHAKSRETYGHPRIHAALLLEGETCSRKRVARLMKKAQYKQR